jgi:hypothetical protein
VKGNGPWGLMWLLDVKALTFSKQLAQRWRWSCLALRAVRYRTKNISLSTSEYSSCRYKR